MYRIIGADGQQYGPATADQLRQWIAEGRVNAQTLVFLEGAAEWRPLQNFPEFANALGSAAPAPQPPPLSAPRVPAPAGAKSKLAAGLLGVLLGAWGVHRFYLGYVGIGVAQIIVTIFTCGIGALWGFIEGILILTGSIYVDAQGRPLTD